VERNSGCASEPMSPPDNRDPAGRGGGMRCRWHGWLTADRRIARGADLGSVISIPSGVRVLLATRPVDFRKGAHGLATLVAEVLGEDPFSGAVVVFRAKRADRIKILVWDGSGLVLVWKQMPQGSFRWPPVMDGVMRLSAVEFAALFDGLDWTRVQATLRIPTPIAAG
jgi:transposase